MEQIGEISVRDAAEADLEAIIDISKATNQEEDWNTVFPDYVRFLIAHGRFLVGERAGQVAGFGGTRQIGAGPSAVSMLTDLFVDPAVHGKGTGRAILDALWGAEPRKMTFSSLHSNALPLYTSFGVDAWWPLLYLGGDVSRLERPAGWSVERAEPAEVGALEFAWTGVDRTADHQLWAARPGGVSLIASWNGRPAAAGSGGGIGSEYRLSHLVVAGTAEAGSVDAADAVIAVLSWLNAANGGARVCLPAPHPAVRQLLAAGWKVSEFDLYMASEPGLIDPLRSVPAPGLA
jgi:GNAT superfamily N-acetyltransferase